MEELSKLSLDGQLLMVLRRSVEVGCRVVNMGGLITHRGVPQGGIMSGLLYNIGLRGLDTIVSCPMFRYADDTHLLISGENDTNEQKISDYQGERGIENNPKKTKKLKVADPKKGELVSFGKTIQSDGRKIDIVCQKIPSPDVQLRINTKLNPVQKLEIYKATTIARWAFGLEIVADLNIKNLDSQMRGKVKELLNVGMHLETKIVLEAIGNKYMPSYFLTKRARNAASETPEQCPQWAINGNPLEVIAPHPLLHNPYGKLLLLLRGEEVAQDAPCLLCGEDNGNTTEHIFQCSSTPDVRELKLDRGQLLQQATNEMLYLLGAAMNKRMAAKREKDPTSTMSQSAKVFHEQWYAAIKAGKTTEIDVKEYIMRQTDYQRDTLTNVKRWFTEKHQVEWRHMEAALQVVIDARRKSDTPEQQKNSDWAREVAKARDQWLLGLMLRKVLSAHRTSGHISRLEGQKILRIDENTMNEACKIIKTASAKFKIIRQEYPLFLRQTMNTKTSGAGSFPVAPLKLTEELRKAIQQKEAYRITSTDPLVKEILLCGIPDNDNNTDEIEVSSEEEESENISEESENSDGNNDSDNEPQSDHNCDNNSVSLQEPVQTPIPSKTCSAQRGNIPITPLQTSLSFMTRTTSRQTATQDTARRKVLNLQRQNSSSSRGGWKP